MIISTYKIVDCYIASDNDRNLHSSSIDNIINTLDIYLSNAIGLLNQGEGATVKELVE